MNRLIGEFTSIAGIILGIYVGLFQMFIPGIITIIQIIQGVTILQASTLIFAILKIMLAGTTCIFIASIIINIGTSIGDFNKKSIKKYRTKYRKN